MNESKTFFVGLQKVEAEKQLAVCSAELRRKRKELECAKVNFESALFFVNGCGTFIYDFSNIFFTIISYIFLFVFSQGTFCHSRTSYSYTMHNITYIS